MAYLLAGITLLPGCGENGRLEFGATVDLEAAVPLSRIFQNQAVGTSGIVVVSGRIGEVCKSAGCWFVLQDVSGGKLYEILTDLKPRASFTVPAGLEGRRAIVSGVLTGNQPDLKLHALGLVVE